MSLAGDLEQSLAEPVKRTLVFLPYGSTPHLETTLEICQRLSEAGHEVLAIRCGAEMLACDLNPEHDLPTCLQCMGRTDAGLARLNPPPRLLPLLDLGAADRAELARVPGPHLAEEDLRGWKIDGFDIGYGVLSSLVTMRGRPELSPARDAYLIRHLARSALAVYRSVRRAIREHRVGSVHVFNGRFAPCRAVLRAAEAEGIPYYTHERGSSVSTFMVRRNAMPHSLDYNRASMRAAWETADPGERAEAARLFYEERRNRIPRKWKSFVTGQERGALPSTWGEAAHHVVIFCSSEDEFVAIGDEWANPIFADQTDGLRRVSEAIGRAGPGVVLHVRVHPNQAGRRGGALARWMAEPHPPNVHVIPPEDPSDSYALLDGADTVVTFGSTIGPEAAYSGKPVVLLARGTYRDLGCTYNPADERETISCLLHPLDPKPRTGAEIFGHYFARFGTPFRDFTPDGFFGGHFRGSTIEPHGARAALIRLLERPSFWRLRRWSGRLALRLTRRARGYP